MLFIQKTLTSNAMALHQRLRARARARTHTHTHKPLYLSHQLFQHSASYPHSDKLKYGRQRRFVCTSGFLHEHVMRRHYAVCFLQRFVTERRGKVVTTPVLYLEGSDHSPPSSAKLMNEEVLYLSLPAPPWCVVGLLYCVFMWKSYVRLSLKETFS